MFKQKSVLIILWMTFITVAAWIGFHIYHISVTSTIDEVLQTQITPIDPNFDMDTINKLKGREKVEPLYQFNEAAASVSSAVDPVSIGADANEASAAENAPPPASQQGAGDATDTLITPTVSKIPQDSNVP